MSNDKDIDLVFPYGSFNANSNPLCVYDTETLRFLMVNDAAIRLYGYCREEFLAMNIRDIQSVEELPAFEKNLRERRAAVQFDSGKSRHRKKDGALFDALVVSVDISLAGKPARFVTIQDLTAQTALSAKLLAISEALAQSPEAVALVTPQGKIDYINPKFTEITGWTEEDLLGKEIALVRLLDAPKSWPDILTDVRSGQQWQATFMNRRKNDQLYMETMTVSPVLDKNGGFAHFLVVKEDVTQHRGTVQQLLLALQAAEMGIWDINLETQEVTWSDGYAKLFGRSAEQHPRTTEAFLALVHETERALFRACIKGTLNGKDTCSCVFRIIWPDQTVHWHEAHGTIFRDAFGKPYRLLGVGKNIDDRKRSEENQSRWEMQVRQTHRVEAIGKLASGIAQNFNNILGGIIGNAELARLSVPEGNPTADHIGNMMVSCRRAAALVLQILAYSKPRYQVKYPIDLAATVREGVSRIRASLPPNVKVEQHISANLPIIKGDPTQIGQVLMNLATNAAEAMLGRAGKIRISLSNIEVDETVASLDAELRIGRYLLLSVSDTGYGMTPEILERMYDPFFTMKEPGEGVGLGLWTVHQIVKSHAGVITVRSQVSQGTTFNLYFPVHAAQPVIPADELTETPLGHGERVLFVDDEIPLTRVAQNAFQSLGYVVDTFTSPLDALAHFRTHSQLYDVVVTDFNMPKMNGVDLAKEILAIRQLPIILTTGYLASLTPDIVSELGISELILKPLTMEVLGRMVARVLKPRPERPDSHS